MTLKALVFFVLLFAVSVLSLQNKYCQLSCDYVVKTFTHTVCDRANQKCGPHPQCGPDFKIIKLSNSDKQYVVDLHNYLRNQVAIGNETRGKQPPAANMNIMTYNEELEFIAQCWANTCNGHPLIHDICRRTAKYDHVGQNLGFINSSHPIIDLRTSINQLIMLWYDEVAIFNSDWVLETKDRGPRFKVGHYTQMLWAESSEIGCATTFYTTKVGDKTWNHLVLVCNYGPGGNYLGLPVYEIGEPTSKCSEGMKPDRYYNGLCSDNKKKSLNGGKFNIFEL